MSNRVSSTKQSRVQRKGTVLKGSRKGHTLLACITGDKSSKMAFCNYKTELEKAAIKEPRLLSRNWKRALISTHTKKSFPEWNKKVMTCQKILMKNIFKHLSNSLTRKDK